MSAEALGDSVVQPRHAASRFGIGVIIEIVVAAVLALQLGATIFSVALRELTPWSVLWVDELAKISLSVIAFLGGTIAYRRAEHASIAVITKRLSGYWQKVLSCLVDLVVLITAVFVLQGSTSLFRICLDEYLPITGLPTATVVAPLSSGSGSDRADGNRAPLVETRMGPCARAGCRGRSGHLPVRRLRSGPAQCSVRATPCWRSSLCFLA